MSKCFVEELIEEAQDELKLIGHMEAAKASLRKGMASVKLQQYETAKIILEVGASLAPEDSRFTYLIKECNERIEEAEEQKLVVVKHGSVVETPNKSPPAIELSSQGTTAPSSKPKYRHEFYQKPDEVVVTIFAKGIPKNNVVVDFGDQIEKEEKLDGDAALNKFSRDIYKDSDEDTRRAMSNVESNGTVLSTNWKEVGSKKIEGSAPDGMEVKKWEY